MVLKVQDLAIGYVHKSKKNGIAKHLNFGIEKGELVAIIGPNGIGKSTLLKTLTNILPPISGNMILNSKNLTAYAPVELAKVQSVVLTETIPSKNLTVMELIALGRQPYTNWLGTLSEDDKNIISIILEKVQLTEIQHKKCYELSDGQFQKVLIARALAQNTSLIILDEPTTHLDIYHKAYTLNLLKNIAKEEQKSILFSTHEINLAIQLCDKILILKEKASAFGNPSELIKQGSFDSLFPNNFIAFDKISGSFRITSSFK